MEVQKLSPDKLVESTKAFMGENPAIFGNPLTIASSDRLRANQGLVNRASELKIALNNAANSLNIQGGDISLIIGEISNLIRRLEILLTGRAIGFRETRRGVSDINHKQRIKGKPSVTIDGILAVETAHSDLELSTERRGTVIDGIAVEERRIRKIYRALHIIFSLANEKELPGHLGWIFLNLTVDALANNMNNGHALGRLWDGYEVDANALQTAQTQLPQNGSTNSITLVANLNHASQFGADPLGIQTHLLEKDLTAQRIRLICEFIAAAVTAKERKLVKGGRIGRNLLPQARS